MAGGRWEGCRQEWIPGCVAGRDEMDADERGRVRRRKSQAGNAAFVVFAGSRERRITGAGRALGNQGGDMEEKNEENKQK